MTISQTRKRLETIISKIVALQGEYGGDISLQNALRELRKFEKRRNL